MIFRTLSALLLALGLPGVATGQEERILKTGFARYDTDKDGVVSREEFPGSDRQFTAIDSNKNGKLTFDEYKVSAVARQTLAARNRARLPPRERVDRAAQTHRRLQNRARFDPNKDGKIARGEWLGSAEAFDTLDLDKSGVIDKKDAALARSAHEARTRNSAGAIYEQFNARLPTVEEIFRRHDDNKDELLTRAEVGQAKFAVLFPVADYNQDDLLDMNEVRAMYRRVTTQVTMRNYGNIKYRAYKVPFSTWDKNNDDRLDTGEWQADQTLFSRIDLNRDGAVVKQEVTRYELSVEGENFVQKFDLNSDGKVTEAEFGGPADAFRRADRNGDGIVNSSDR